MNKTIKNFLKRVFSEKQRAFLQRTYAYLKYFLSVILGKRYHFKLQTKIPVTPVGNDYGGQMIASPLASMDNLIVFSVGIGEDCSFDREMIEKFNAMVYAFDPTPRAIAFVDKQNLPKESFCFLPFGLEAFDGEAEFNLPSDDNPEPSGNVVADDNRINKRAGETLVVQMRRLRTLMDMVGVDKIDILKMDIEGSEFAVIEDILNSDVKFTQLCVEFHERMFKDGKEKIKKAVTQLNGRGYSICAISPSWLEVTFVNK